MDSREHRHDETPEITLSDLDRIRAETERAIERTRADLERIEALFLALQVRWTKAPIPRSLTPFLSRLATIGRPHEPPAACA